MTKCKLKTETNRLCEIEKSLLTSIYGGSTAADEEGWTDPNKNDMSPWKKRKPKKPGN